jgi:hypothetical protein
LPRLVRLFAALAAAAVAGTACSSGSAGAGPLVTDVQQKGFISCIPAPGYPSTGVEKWNTPIGFALDMYLNQSNSSLTIESVSLIDPHNLILHRTLVFEMAHARNPLVLQAAWNQLGRDAQPAAWAQRQAVPGAVIPPADPSVAPKDRATKGNLYEIVPDISASTPGGGWALGELVRYRAAGRSYTASAYTGYAIGSSVTDKNYCGPQNKAISAAFGIKG